MAKALFLDRDGIVNKDLGYVGTIERFILEDCIVELLKYFTVKDYLIFIVTNQSGIARGYYSEQQMLMLHQHIIDIMQQEGITISEIKFCPHLPESSCECRKPKPSMISQLVDKYHICVEKSVLIGDKKSDIEAGLSAGLQRNILINKNSVYARERVNRFDNLSAYLKHLQWNEKAGKNI